MQVIRTLSELRQAVSALRKQGQRIAFVPTMGALHSGHISLIEQGKERADAVVVSIFVNPTQFAPTEDFDAYPRPEAEDIAKLEQNGVAIAYLPAKEEMYPEPFTTSIQVGGVSKGLCSATRPQFFAGVALVVCKLLMQVLPDIALFGEKDYQQLQVVKRMVANLDIPVDIYGAPILREKDGLAMSSRNAYLTPEERKIAPELYATLKKTAEWVKTGAVEAALRAGKDRLLEAGFAKIDYLELHDATTLDKVMTVDAPTRLLVAAWLGKCRLIDNIEV